MLAQAAGLALLASISPTALLVASVYLGSARPRLTGSLYLAGAVAISTIMAALVLVIVRGTGLNLPARHNPRYGLRLGLGIVLLAAGALAAARKPRIPAAAAGRPGLVASRLARPAPLSAFVTGLLVYFSGLSFLAALQVIATARATLLLTTLATAVVVIINVAFVWLPLLLHLFAPQATGRRLRALNGWLRAHGRAAFIAVSGVAGVIMVLNGSYGLATR